MIDATEKAETKIRKPFGTRSFLVYDLSLEVVREIRPLLWKIRRADLDLYRQLRRAASSTPLNLAEGNRRVGKDRAYHFRVAAGSADETRAVLDVAAAWGDLDDGIVEPIRRRIDRILGMIYGLTR